MNKIILATFFLILSGCLNINQDFDNTNTYPQIHNSSIQKNLSKIQCLKDEDCACGRNIYTKECYYGPKELVDISNQCPDFCTGIANNLEIKCINFTCIQIKKDSSNSFCKDLCGDGICQEIVCLALGCPCPENKDTCPQDCKN